MIGEVLPDWYSFEYVTDTTFMLPVINAKFEFPNSANVFELGAILINKLL